MISTEVSPLSPVNKFTFITTLGNKKNSKKLSARWKVVDGKLVCRWSSK